MYSSVFSASLILFCLLLFSSSTVTAMDISRALGKYPKFQQFNNLLNQTGLNKEINNLKTITILALSDGQVSQISSNKQNDEIKNILKVHVILDYFDSTKLKQLSKNASILTTMFQKSGIATQKQGFLNVTRDNGEIVFGSAVKDAPHDSKLLGSVMSQPYDLSVLEISNPITVPNISAASAPAQAPSPTKKPALAPEAEAPTEDEPSSPPSKDDEDSTNSGVDTPAASPTMSSASKRLFAMNVCLALLAAVFGV